MEGLEEWSTAFTGGEEGLNELMFPKLNTLIIEQCAKFKLNGNTRQLTRLHTLTLSNCRSLTSLPQWYGEQTPLKKIEIKDCDGIRSLPDSIQQLTKLRCLRIIGCPTLVKWCKSEENKMKIAHIRDKDFLYGRYNYWPETPSRVR